MRSTHLFAAPAFAARVAVLALLPVLGLGCDEGMLATQGIDESAPELIAFLNSAASDTRPKEGFGTVCQHYFNLCQQGVGRDAALERLKDA